MQVAHSSCHVPLPAVVAHIVILTCAAWGGNR